MEPTTQGEASDLVWCNVCQEHTARSPSGKCRPCGRRHSRAYKDRNAEAVLERERKRKSTETSKQRIRADNLRRNFSMTMEQYEAMLAAQGGGCAICGATDPGPGRDGVKQRFAVDHDRTCCPTHIKTCGKCIRGLLCRKCNVAVGHFRDDPDILRNAIAYLEAWKARRATTTQE